MNEQANLTGAQTYFGQAVFDLACGTDSLRERIKLASDFSLKHIDTTHLTDHDLKVRIDKAKKEASRADLDDATARDLAKEIVEIAFRLKKI